MAITQHESKNMQSLYDWMRTIYGKYLTETECRQLLKYKPSIRTEYYQARINKLNADIADAKKNSNV